MRAYCKLVWMLLQSSMQDIWGSLACMQALTLATAEPSCVGHLLLISLASALCLSWLAAPPACAACTPNGTSKQLASPELYRAEHREMVPMCMRAQLILQHLGQKVSRRPLGDEELAAAAAVASSSPESKVAHFANTL